MITLKELCKEGNVTRRSIQCFEEKGLIKPCSKNKMGYLLYDEKTISQVKQIRFYQNIGFSLLEIQNLSRLSKDEYLSKLQNQLTILKKQKTNLEKDILKLSNILKNENTLSNPNKTRR